MNNELRLLMKAVMIATRAHAGQLYNAEPYINHSLRVADRCDTVEEMMVAVLHDVVEDTHVTLDELRRYGFSDRVLDAVHAMTRQLGETYASYIIRLSENELATTVKLHDLRENRSWLPLSDKFAHPESMANRYDTAIAQLEATQLETQAS